MKLTESKLKEYVLNVLLELQAAEESEKDFGTTDLKSAAAKTLGIDTAKRITTAGIDDREKGILAQIQKALTAAAAAKDIKSGGARRELEQLYTELEKLLKED